MKIILDGIESFLKLKVLATVRGEIILDGIESSFISAIFSPLLYNMDNP